MKASAARNKEQARAKTPPENQRTGRAVHAYPPASNRSRQTLVAPESSGRPLETSVREEMEPRFGRDLSSVRVHPNAPASATGGAAALTAGNDVVFGAGQYAPDTMAGRKLLAHELAHVVQQDPRGGRARRSTSAHSAEHEAERASHDVLRGRNVSVSPIASPPRVQFRLNPEDVGSEMVGMTFEMTKAFSVGAVRLQTGDHVTIEAWDVNAAHDARVKVASGRHAGARLTVPEKFIRPVRAAAPGVAPYSAGVGKAAAAVEKAESDLDAWLLGASQYKSAGAKRLFAAEQKRREGVLSGARRTLNRREIQEAMFNRFDVVIEREVRIANAQHSLTGSDALDPNLVKALLFQESQLGTSGRSLVDPPADRLHTRFNIGQVTDSAGIALLTMFEREDPARLTKFGLDHMRKDLVAAQGELAALEKKPAKSLTPKHKKRHAELKLASGKNWENFIWAYKAPGAKQGFEDAVVDFFNAAKPHRNLDYEFWIHLAVMWIFEKKRKGMKWEDAIKAYNSGKAAEDYKLAIVKRAADAAGASGGAVSSGSSSGSSSPSFIPEGI